MAASLPDSRFVGVDLSSVQVGEGQKLIGDLGLKNVELKHLSILDVSADMGKFDYILCHGVFSWVPAGVQEKILAICSENLSRDGIAYVSYNTYPGWHMRGMIRDMLSYHAEQFVDPRMRVGQARNLLDFLAKSVERENSPYSLLLKQEVNSIRRCSDSYLFHEHLEEVNEPIYFRQFIERAVRHKLKYLGEVDLRVMVPGNYPPEIENVLHMLSSDIIRMEQYMDFLRNRMFRQTLLCHAGQNPNYSLRAEQVKSFHVASPAKAAKAEPVIHTPEEELFETPDGITLTSREPIVKAAMVHLSKVWPRTMPFMEVLGLARESLKALGKECSVQDDILSLSQAFLTFYVSASTSLLELHVEPARFVTGISTKPQVWPLARLQAVEHNRVTNLRHESVYLGNFERHLVRLMDGTHDRADLISLLMGLVDGGELSVEKDGQAVIDKTQRIDMIAQSMDNQLQLIARNALLVG
jgi:methyltransferase-like protein/SAM-dependent methyltransferase